MRWLFAATKPEQNLLFGYTRGDETRRRFLIPLWNVYSFFVSYALLDQWVPDGEAGQSPNPAHAQLDSWIVERLKETTLSVRAALDKYDAERACSNLESFLDDLSNWYVRRSRRRFWKSETDNDKAAAYATLHHVLVEFIKLLAPFIPFTTEAMYQNLVRSIDKNAPTSIHHCLYPAADVGSLDSDLLEKMRLAITTASLGRAARGSADIKLRQPLAKARVNVGSQQQRSDLLELADVLSEEINVKEIEVVSEVGELVNYKLLPNNRVLGPRFGSSFPKVRAALMAFDPAEAARILQAGDELTVEVDGEVVSLSKVEVLVQTESRGGMAVASDKGVTVAVDINLTRELIQEGYARDLVRAINNMRKEAGLDIADRIELAYQAEGDVALALSNFASYIQQETLALAIENKAMLQPTYQSKLEIGGEDIVIALSKV
jgi:isoleucyl-tRNA synthetase